MVISGSWTSFFGLKYQDLPTLLSDPKHYTGLHSCNAMEYFYPNATFLPCRALTYYPKWRWKVGEWWLLLVVILTSHHTGFYQTSCDLKKKKKQQPCHCFIFQCSVSCGRGHKQRNVYCMAKDGSHLESDYCKHLAKPNGHRKCRGGRCPRWKAGAWSQVSNASPLPLLRYLQAHGWHHHVGLCSSAQFWFFRGELGDGEGRIFMSGD